MSTEYQCTFVTDCHFFFYQYFWTIYPYTANNWQGKTCNKGLHQGAQSVCNFNCIATQTFERKKKKKILKHLGLGEICSANGSACLKLASTYRESCLLLFLQECKRSLCCANIVSQYICPQSTDVFIFFNAVLQQPLYSSIYPQLHISLPLPFLSIKPCGWSFT